MFIISMIALEIFGTINTSMLAIFIATLVSFPTYTALQAPIFEQQLTPPLYDSIKLLIADESFNAQLVLNETANHLSEASYILEKTLDQLTHFNPVERLNALNDIVKHPNWRHCYKDYERQIAHFNREFIIKYNICKQTLDVAATHLEDETFEEIEFIRNAPLEIQRVREVCKVSDLKRKDHNHAGIVLCVIAHIGQIDQRLMESSQLVLDIIAEITMNTDIGDDSCHEYNELKQEYNEVYFSITDCLDQFVN